MGFLWGFRWSFGLRYYRDPAEGPQRRESWKARPLPWYAMRRTELGNRLLICAQAFGEAHAPDEKPLSLRRTASPA